jgi:hypothetical protein
MRASMGAADSLYASSFGNPANLTTACVKAAYAMPELNRLFDALGKNAVEQPQAAAGHAALISSANDGSVLGYLEAYGVAVWDTASDYASDATRTWNGMVRMAAFATGFGSAMLKCLLIALTLIPLYLLLLAAAAIVWFMQQLRFFLAVTGSMMLPLFTGMFSMPAGHFNRQAAQGYVMHMVSLALWPVAWAIGHSGTVVLYDALIALIAGTSRVPDMLAALQWSAVTSSGVTAAQVTTAEAALGNWFMGNLAALLSILVGGIGFVLWVFIVSIMGPVFLHKLLVSGAHFMAEAAGTTARVGFAGGKLAFDHATKAGAGRGLPVAVPGSSSGERLVGATAGGVNQLSTGQHGTGGTPGNASMQDAARQVDDSDGKKGARL